MIINSPHIIVDVLNIDCKTFAFQKVLVYFIQNMDKQGRLSRGIARIARETDLCDSTVDRAIAWHKKAGLVRLTKRGYGNRYNKDVDGVPNDYVVDLERLKKLATKS